MPTRRLDIELSWDEYELLRREAEARGTTIPALIHELIVSQRARLLEGAKTPAGMTRFSSATDHSTAPLTWPSVTTNTFTGAPADLRGYQRVPVQW